ncbi:2-isopropylmalate synthase [Spongiibacter sp. KMU-166]|uniref:2-isopropylmalate synthase n=1 Tax=Spongiibacter thalassae TaxID=2721624 RepID=A0ABX1GEL4_9GAMM|nr:2-isopropylmalate synthase [Spongiibacter thalassae]NKI17639.1 2-isopropylmalate synthase [Spongiibacter thalassae]
MSFDHRKYRPAAQIAIPDRQWPSRVITSAPDWCSVDLRDGNQALVEPMTVQQKLRMWDLLVKLGFKEIEVGFPSASQPDFDFVRALIDGDRIPDDVTIQVLVQAREELIVRSFEALRGAKKAIVHVYNSTSPVQRERVFGMDKAGITAIAVQGAKWVRDYAAQNPDTEWSFQYSPESFSSTEVDYAVEICDAVIEQWRDSGRPLIINLPATVECATPNIFADQVEYFCRNSRYRSDYRVSIHTHNDRGCGVAAAELAVMAGADRIEGTLLGNGERTGNMDIVTMAMNLYSQGVDPKLDFSNMDEIIAVVEHCTTIPLHPRHPYAGDLVFTAFSGSHQDAIKKCMARQRDDEHWQVAYLPIDPADLNRSYEAVIRINSQSGKGGVAWVLENDFGLQMPRWLQIDASRKVQAEAEARSGELSPKQIWSVFEDNYLAVSEHCALHDYSLRQNNDKHGGRDQLTLHFNQFGSEIAVTGTGEGAISALVNGWRQRFGDTVEIIDYSEHAMNSGTESLAIAYILLSINGQRYIGIARHRDVVSASLQAVINAAAQSLHQRQEQEEVLESQAG